MKKVLLILSLSCILFPNIISNFELKANEVEVIELYENKSLDQQILEALLYEENIKKISSILNNINNKDDCIIGIRNLKTFVSDISMQVFSNSSYDSNSLFSQVLIADNFLEEFYVACRKYKSDEFDSGLTFNNTLERISREISDLEIYISEENEKIIEKVQEKVFFCIGEENLVYKRKKPSDCPSAMTAITREEFCIGNYERKNWNRQEGYTDNAYLFFTEYCSTEEKKIALEKQEQKIEEDVKIESIKPITKPEF